MILDLQSRLTRTIQEAVRKALAADLPGVTFQYPPRTEMGDLALTAPFDLAKTLRRKPREIAEASLASVEPARERPASRRAEVAGGGYVNLFLERGAFARELHDSRRQPAPAPARPTR